MAQFKKCIKKYETRLEVLTEVSQSNFEELQKLNPILDSKIELGDFICNSNVEPYLPVVLDRNLKMKQNYNVRFDKTSYLEISEDRTYILVKNHKTEILTFVIIETKEELQFAKQLLSHFDRKNLKKNSILISNKSYSNLFQGSFVDFNLMYDVIQ